MQINVFRSNRSNAGDTLFNESIGGDIRYWDSDLSVYDTDSGKYYPSVFELEESFWASCFYSIEGSLPFERSRLPEYTPVECIFEPYTVPQIGIHYHFVAAKLGDNYQAPIINMLEFG